jgi:uncharacterized membrane protein
MSVTCFNYILNAQLVESAYCAYNEAWTFYGQANYAFGVLFLLFMIMMFIQNRNLAFNFLVTLILFFGTFIWIPPIIRNVIIIIMLFELTAVIWDWFFNEGG